VTLLPDEDPTLTPDPDVDTTTPLGVVPNDDRPPALADAAVRDAVTWIESELGRLREQRAERDRTGLAEIKAMQRKLIEDRETVNASIKELVAEQARLARVLRVLDQ
jgi:hypothetical protein